MNTNYFEIKKNVLLSLDKKIDRQIIKDDYIPQITITEYTFMQKISLINRLIELDFVEEGKEFLDTIDVNDSSLNYENRLFIGLSYMKLGFRKGFELYHNRIDCPGCKSCNGQYNDINNQFDKNKYWNNQDLTNKSIYIISEQGHGDLIMWIRYLLYFSNSTIYLLVHGYDKKIVPICDRIFSFCAGRNNLQILDTLSTEYDYWVYMCDLTIKFNMAFTLPTEIYPYIVADSNKIELWKDKLSNIKEKIICVNLSGADDVTDPRRIKIEEIEELFSLSEYKFININLKVTIDHPNVIQFNDIDKDIAYSDTLAIMSLSYKVISSDTSIIHLAGAMNITSLLILPLYAEWRWFTDNHKTVWYPSVTIIRKNKIENLVERIKELLS